MTVRFYSTNGDDDFISLIGAYAIGSNGKPKHLSFVRTCQFCNEQFNPDSYRWYVTTDVSLWTQVKSKVSTSTSYKDGLWVENDQYTLASAGWRSCGGGTLVRIKRTGDIIEAWTTPFKTSGNSAAEIKALELGTKITVNLNEVLGGLFTVKNGGARVGYGTQSQAETRYENISINLEGKVVDTRNNNLSTYNPITGAWSYTSTGFNSLSTCGFGRLMKNDLTQKTFYVSQNNINRVVDNYESLFTDIKSRIETMNSKIDAQITKLNSIV